MKFVSPHPKLRSALLTRGFIVAALVLCSGSGVVSLRRFLQGDISQALLLSAVSIFAGWMAAAVHQFQQRLSGIDEIVRQASRRVKQSDAILAEMQELARRLRASATREENDADRTLH